MRYYVTVVILTSVLLLVNDAYSQFSSVESIHRLPELDEQFDDQLYGDFSNYGLLDMNGDGLVDLIDCESANGGVFDLNGQHYWKVYINTGGQFSSTAQQWFIPDLGEVDNDQLYGEFSNYSMLDMNGDGRPDLIDAEDNASGTVWDNNGQRYWKVYVNTGTSFQLTAVQWHIPDLGEQYDDQVFGDYGNYGLADMNGDGRPDLIDAEDNNSGSVWMNAGQRYWKVFKYG